MARDGFHDTLFPAEVSLGARGGPSRKTDIVRLASGSEVRRSRWSQSLRQWDVSAGIRTSEDAEAVLAFFEAREGRRFAFAFHDPFDHSSAPGNAAPDATDQPLGTADGTTATFPFVKTYGSAQRTIELAKAGTVRVAVDGVELTSGWSLDPDRNAVTFDGAPGAGADLTAGFLFDTPVRFASDELILEAGARGAAFPSIELIEVRL